MVRPEGLARYGSRKGELDPFGAPVTNAETFRGDFPFGDISNKDKGLIGLARLRIRATPRAMVRIGVKFDATKS